MLMKKFDGYYRKITRSIIDDVDLIVKLLQGCDNADMQEIMNEYFKAYWSEFKVFWAQSGENIDWITFALMPHNAHYFITYVFNEHPEIRIRVMNDYHEK